MLRASNGDFLVMSDNGFGAQNNSADYVLRVYRISPDFRTKQGGSGTIDVRSFFTLRDPYHRINFPIVADGEFYYGSVIPVDPAIRERRLLTGADFDIESFREAPDGTLWFGDEFGPFLIHTDRARPGAGGALPAAGRQVAAESVPRRPARRIFRRAAGFEGMAITPDGKTLYPMLEGRADDRSRSATAHHQPVRPAEAPLHRTAVVLSPRGDRVSPSATSPR